MNNIGVYALTLLLGFSIGHIACAVWHFSDRNLVKDISYWGEIAISLIIIAIAFFLGGYAESTVVP